tara:strand:+ start:377 stop:841 length:465 start_codon:yes stop_codon:yes gene_type:complete
MTTLQLNTETVAETETPTDKAYARAYAVKRNGKVVDNLFHAVLMDDTDKVIDSIPFETFTSAAKAEVAGLAHWLHAFIDIDEEMRVFEAQLRAKLPKWVAAHRVELLLRQDARSMAAREGITVDEALKNLKAMAKARAAEKSEAAEDTDDVFGE